MSDRGLRAIQSAVAACQSGRALEFDALLLATGRKPVVDGSGLAAAVVTCDHRLGIGAQTYFIHLPPINPTLTDHVRWH